CPAMYARTIRSTSLVVRTLAFAAAELETAARTLPRAVTPFHLRGATQAELHDLRDHASTVWTARDGAQTVYSSAIASASSRMPIPSSISSRVIVSGGQTTTPVPCVIRVRPTPHARSRTHGD